LVRWWARTLVSGALGIAQQGMSVKSTKIFIFNSKKNVKREYEKNSKTSHEIKTKLKIGCWA